MKLPHVSTNQVLCSPANQRKKKSKSLLMQTVIVTKFKKLLFVHALYFSDKPLS